MGAIKTYFYVILSIFTILLVIACSKVEQLPLLSSDATILAFGDSLTAGTGASETESYPAILSQIIGRKVINAGVPGEVSATGLQRLPELLEQVKPSLLILCHGGNDLLARQNHQQIAENLRGMIRIAKERQIPVLLVAVPSPDFSLKPPFLYYEMAKEFKIPIEMKTLSHILGKSSLKSDHIHPNAAGYRIFAEDLSRLLKKSGAISP